MDYKKPDFKPKPKPKDKAALESFYKIKDKMIKYDKDMHKLYEEKPELFKKPDFRYYTKKNNNLNNVENIYLTSVFISESYIPGALVLAYSLKKVKSKFPVVCMVQDVPYEEDGKILFEGVSKDTIYNLLEVFDMVIGVNLLKIKNHVKPDKISHWSNSSTYVNVLYYITKGYILALTQFKKILYFDSSNYVVKNIDDVFEENNLSRFVEDRDYVLSKAGYYGSLALFIPNIIYYYKLINFTNNYKKYFSNNYFVRTADEIVIYYSIYPHWNSIPFPGEMKCNPKFKDYMIYNIGKVPINKLTVKNQDYCLTQHFVVYKPFKAKPLEFLNNVFNKLYLLFEKWDLLANELLKKHKNLKKYFEHIPKIRKQKIFNDKNNIIHKKKKEKDFVKAIVKSKKSKIIKKIKKSYLNKVDRKILV